MNTYLSNEGNYNSLPEPYEPATWHDFVHMWSSYTPDKEVYRQILDPRPEEQLPKNKFHHTPTRYVCSVRILYFHTCAFAVFMPCEWDLKNGKMEYTEEPFYYRIGCEHKNRKELSQKECLDRGLCHEGGCFHVYACPDCGLTESYDSSG